MSKSKTLRARADERGARAITENGEIAMSGENPSPVDHLLASLAGCAGITLLAILQKQRAEVRDILQDLRAEYDPNPYRIRTIRIHFTIDAENLTRRNLDTALDLMERHCPVHAALSPEIDIAYTAEMA